MAKKTYTVTLYRTASQEGVVEVEARSPEEAEEFAYGIARNSRHIWQTTEWDFDITMTEVEAEDE